MSNIDLSKLEQVAVGIDKVEAKLGSLAAVAPKMRELIVADEQKKLQNIGDIGIAVDHSNASLRNELQNDFPLANWLLSTPASARLRGRSGLAFPHKDENGEWTMLLPTTVGTLPPADTSGACCWLPFDIAKCNGSVILKLLCLKDCESIFDTLVNMNRTPSGGDLTSFFQRPGETVKAARDRMARWSMAFFTARNIILGVSDAGTDVLKPFHGLLEVMENDAVINIDGSSILGAFDALWCRAKLLGSDNFAIAVHPLTYEGIAMAVQPGRFGQLPNGWVKTGDTLTFHGMQFIQDKLVPYDPDTNTGEAWVLDGNAVGAYMGTTLLPTEEFAVRNQVTTTNDPAQGCAAICDYWYNYGATFNTDANRLALITNIPGSASCSGNALQGLEGLINPDTLVPMD